MLECSYILLFLPLKYFLLLHVVRINLIFQQNIERMGNDITTK